MSHTRAEGIIRVIEIELRDRTDFEDDEINDLANHIFDVIYPELKED